MKTQLLGGQQPTKYNGRAKDARPSKGKAWRGWGTMFFLAISIWLVSCDTEPEFSCGEIEYLETTPEDTFFYGEWRWAYTKVYCWDAWPSVIGEWHVTDSIYPGETRSWLPEGHPEHIIELGDSVVITTDGERNAYCFKRWQSYRIIGSSLYGPPAPWLGLHVTYNNEEISDVVSFVQYDALAQDTVEIFPDFKIDSTCGLRTKNTVNYYIRSK